MDTVILAAIRDVFFLQVTTIAILVYVIVELRFRK